LQLVIDAVSQCDLFDLWLKKIIESLQ
jgi:hypothetical protein